MKMQNHAMILTNLSQGTANDCLIASLRIQWKIRECRHRMLWLQKLSNKGKDNESSAVLPGKYIRGAKLVEHASISPEKRDPDTSIVIGHD